MDRSYFTPIFAALLTIAFTLHSGAAEPSGGGDVALRDRLRALTQQLRSVEAEQAGLQSAKTALAEENKALTAQVEQLRKNAVEDKKVWDKKVSDLDIRLGEKETELAQFKEAVERWKTGYEKASELARTVDAQRAKLVADNLELQRMVAERERKNIALFFTGNEILTRYEQFSLGNALGAKEPFVGSTRVKLENLVQDYQDKLLAEKVRN
jgi:predicted RNase H-like nuclease (RuvC/YqgF family)